MNQRNIIYDEFPENMLKINFKHRTQHNIILIKCFTNELFSLRESHYIIKCYERIKSTQFYNTATNIYFEY